MIGSRRMLVGLLALAVLMAWPSLACVPCCAPCTVFGEGPTSPCGTIAISRDAALRLESKVATIQGNSFQLTLSDEELTSWIALKLPEFQAANPDLAAIPVTDPQICFTNGKVYVTGQLMDPVQANFSLVVTVQVVNNQVRLNMESGQLGPLPMPQDILDSLGKAAEETINSPSFNVRFNRIQVLDRVIMVEGYLENP
ncbi:MAG: hypothetical protein KKA73_19100 [Chloroflexi bacterium]|nr:hypothetical protein [Chloroflexota bacterium]MBU1749798.1 hypothetical protein [Chloroflexota bacterium]